MLDVLNGIEVPCQVSGSSKVRQISPVHGQS